MIKKQAMTGILLCLISIASATTISPKRLDLDAGVDDVVFGAVKVYGMNYTLVNVTASGWDGLFSYESNFVSDGVIITFTFDSWGMETKMYEGNIFLRFSDEERFRIPYTLAVNVSRANITTTSTTTISSVYTTITTTITACPSCAKTVCNTTEKDSRITELESRLTNCNNLADENSKLVKKNTELENSVTGLESDKESIARNYADCSKELSPLKLRVVQCEQNVTVLSDAITTGNSSVDYMKYGIIALVIIIVVLLAVRGTSHHEGDEP